MKKIAVLTSGGDAPGMNAAIRAVTREALVRGVEVMGIQNGYMGLLSGDMISLGARSVGGIINAGGTMLGSARCAEFRTDEGVRKGVECLDRAGIEGLVVIGGNGSQTGAARLAEEGVPVVGVASTIDNDLCGSDMTIGVDTALNIALEALDRLRVTARSHRRALLIEVMGRDCGFLALMTGLAGGAEAVIIPEVPTTPQAVADALAASWSRGKMHALAVVAEGSPNNARVLEAYFRENRERIGFDLRVTTLGHVQRGGIPNAFDRILATRLGAAATDALLTGQTAMLAGWQKGGVILTPYREIIGKTKQPPKDLLELVHRLAQ